MGSTASAGPIPTRRTPRPWCGRTARWLTPSPSGRPPPHPMKIRVGRRSSPMSWPGGERQMPSSLATWAFPPRHPRPPSVIDQEQARKFWTSWVRREIGGSEMIQEAAVSAAVDELLLGHDNQAAADAARNTAGLNAVCWPDKYKAHATALMQANTSMADAFTKWASATTPAEDQSLQTAAKEQDNRQGVADDILSIDLGVPLPTNAPS